MMVLLLFELHRTYEIIAGHSDVVMRKHTGKSGNKFIIVLTY